MNWSAASRPHPEGLLAIVLARTSPLGAALAADPFTKTDRNVVKVPVTDGSVQPEDCSVRSGWSLSSRRLSPGGFLASRA